MKKEVLQYLEHEFGLKLCIHERDFLGGAAIIANIAAAIEHSRRMIMVISKYVSVYVVKHKAKIRPLAQSRPTQFIFIT